MDDRFTLHHGDCIEVMRGMADNSVDAIVTDPPYELTGKSGKGGFMGKEWDATGIAFNKEMWAEALRILKPGGHLLAFSGSRTYHRMAVAIEDAGFEVRDQIMWIYGSGFPKSLDVSKAIDKAAGAEREVIGSRTGAQSESTGRYGAWGNDDGSGRSVFNETAPATPAAQQWQGWGTALKPAHEPIVLARKPLIGTVAATVLAHGTGALNIDGCRVAAPDNDGKVWVRGGQGVNARSGPKAAQDIEQLNGETELVEPNPQGRWPANVIHDGSDEVVAGFPVTHGSGNKSDTGTGSDGDYDASSFHVSYKGRANRDYGLTGGSAARFFYCAKASKRDRNSGVQLCVCKKGSSWANEDQQAAHLAATEQSAARDTGASGTATSSESAWNTSSSGSPSTDLSPMASRSTTLTGTNSTTTPPTSLPLTPSPTSASTQDANSGTANGSSPADSAATSNPSAPTIGTSPGKAGPSTGDAAPATSPELSPTNGHARLWCANCGGLRGGHPTVKPTDLMRYLIRLITPPGAVVLDPFMGSGSTGKAAMFEGVRFIGIEQDADYLAIAEARIRWALSQPLEEVIFPRPSEPTEAELEQLAFPIEQAGEASA